jgi:hypothetical protein
VVLALFLGHRRGGVCPCGEGGLGGDLGTGPLGVLGGVPGFPQFFQSPFPCCLLLTEQSRSVPDLALLLFEGVRSGTRRRRGASTSVQAAGGPGRNAAHSARTERPRYFFCGTWPRASSWRGTAATGAAGTTGATGATGLSPDGAADWAAAMAAAVRLLSSRSQVT